MFDDGSCNCRNMSLFKLKSVAILVKLIIHLILSRSFGKDENEDENEEGERIKMKVVDK